MAAGVQGHPGSESNAYLLVSSGFVDIPLLGGRGNSQGEAGTEVQFVKRLRERSPGRRLAVENTDMRGVEVRGGSFQKNEITS